MSTITVWSSIIGLFIAPVLLVYYKIIPPKYRLETLSLICLATIFLAWFNGYSLTEFGLRFDNLKDVAVPYLLFTLFWLIIIVAVAKFYNKTIESNWWHDYRLLLSFIPISFAQEIAYRAFLMPQLDHIFTSAISIIIFNALLFVFLHIIFYDLKYILPLLFMSGVGFACMYSFFPNLIMIGLAHSVLNLIAVMYGFFSIEKIKSESHPIHKIIDRRWLRGKLSFNQRLGDLFFILLIATVLISLLSFGIIPANNVLLVALVVLILILFVGLHEGWTLKDFGLRVDNLGSALPIYFLFTALFFGLMLIAAHLFDKSLIIPFSDLFLSRAFYTILFWQIIISVVQAFIFRGFLVTDIENITRSKLYTVIIASIIFTLIHVMYTDFTQIWYLILIAGLGFSITYIYRPNIILSSLSHVIINMTAILFGFLSLIN